METSWEAFVEEFARLTTEADATQWLRGWMLWESFGKCDSPWGKTITDLAAAVQLSESYCYELMRVSRRLWHWVKRQQPIPPWSICRTTVFYDEDRAVELMEQWISEGRPTLQRWREKLEAIDPEDDNPLASVVRVLMRKTLSAKLDAEAAAKVPLRGLNNDRIASIDQACEFWVALRRRARAIQRARKRSQVPQEESGEAHGL